jgi:outer membrane protein TolC
MLNRIIFLSVTLLTGLSSPGQNLLTLDESMRLALVHNHELQIARLDAQQAKNNATVGNAGRLPSVTAAGGTNYSNQNSNLEFATGQTQDVKGAESLSQNISIGVSQVLFAGGRIQRSYQLLKYAKEAANLREIQALETTIAQVWSQYTAVSLLQRTVSIAIENFSISMERFEKARLTNELGGSNSTEFMAAKVDMNRDKVELMEAETQLESAKNSFATFIGYDQNYKVVDKIPFDIEEQFDETEILESMRLRNTSIQLAIISSETAEIQRQLQNATLFPTVSAQAGYGINQSQAEAGFLTASQQNGLNAGVNLQYNLFSGFQSRTQRQNSEIEVLKAEHREAQTQELMENTVKNAVRTFNNAVAVAKLEADNAEVANERMRKINELYSLGQASSLEQRQAQLAWLAAENGKSSSEFRAVNAQIALYQLMGTLQNATN